MSQKKMCGNFSFSGVSSVIPLSSEGMMNSDKYVIERKVIQDMRRAFLDGGGIFQQNRAPCTGPDLTMGNVGLSLGPQDPWGPPTNYGTHTVNWRYMIRSINIRQNFMSSLFMKLSFIHLMRFRVDNARFFQPVSTNLNMIVGQDICRLYCSVVVLKAGWRRLLRSVNRTDCYV